MYSLGTWFVSGNICTNTPQKGDKDDDDDEDEDDEDDDNNNNNNNVQRH
jgi:hypothetical protein